MPLPSQHIARARRLAWLVLLLTWLALPLAAQTVRWQKTYGLTYGSGTSTYASNDITAALATPGGGFLLTGTTYQNSTGTAPGNYGLVVKVNASGNVLWQNTFGLTNAVKSAVATPDGGFLIAGTTTQNIPGTMRTGSYGLVVKVNASGNVLWQTTFGLTYEYYGTAASNAVKAAVATPDGGFLIAGTSVQNTPSSNPNYSYTGTYGLVVKVDASGNVRSQQTCGLTYTLPTYSSPIYGSGTTTFAANDFTAAIATPDGGFLLTGTTATKGHITSSPSPYDKDTYGLVVKVDANGNVLWQKSCGLTYTLTNAYGTTTYANNAVKAAVATSDGGFLLAGNAYQNISGTTSTGNYGLVVKVDASGNVLSQQTSGLTYTSGSYTSSQNYLSVAVATPDGGFLLAGYTIQNLPGSNNSGSYGLVVKVDADGNVLSQQTHGLTYTTSDGTRASNNLSAAVATPDGGFLLAGNTYQI
ncbi:MAG TPA: hypothetical protein VK364_07050, partial [Hymenobacter sp.]|nr:hypothetical protein [Hymenobacter sp.]